MRHRALPPWNHGEFQVDLFDALHLTDCGDVSIVPGNAQRTFERTERCITEIVKAGTFPIIFGGDRFLPHPRHQRHVQLINGQIGYIQIDSHVDTAEDVADERLNHACPVSRTAELPNVDPRASPWWGSTGRSTRGSSVSTSTGPDPDDHHLGHRRVGDRQDHRSHVLDIAWNGTMVWPAH